MATLAERMQGERMARVALSMVGGVETLRLVVSDDPVPGLARADALIWRERLAARITSDPPDGVAETQGGEFGTLIPADKEWPAGLDDLGERAPYLLRTHGATSCLTTALSDRVTIIGSRASTSYGEHVTVELATGMADEERIVVAGGAYGIEGAAHRAVLAAGGQTIAVLAGSVDRPYPSGHRELPDRVDDVGALVSELPPGAVPTRHRFLARSRLLGAMSAATMVVEAGARSGALRVAAEAHQLGRQVGAVPGPVTSVTSYGPHELLRTGHAHVVTSAADVEELTAGRATSRLGLSAEFARRASPAAGPPERSL